MTQVKPAPGGKPPAAPPAAAPASNGASPRVAAAAEPAPVAPAAAAPVRPVTPVVADPLAGSGAVRPAPAAQVRPMGPRRARLLVTRLDPWSVMKTAFMLSVSIAIVTIMAVALLWWTLDVTGVFAAISRTIDDVAGSGTTSFDFLALVSFSRVMGISLVLAAVEIVLMSALTTLFAFLYNLSVGLTGGLEVTLSEDA